jgi:AcrR family transcriptional regulator
MARTVNEDDYAARRNEILDATRQLVYTKGYEQMSIQDILDVLKISKGAFYHYFESKQALLDGLVERMFDEVDQFLVPIVEAQGFSAIEKMRRYFDAVANWKADQKDFMLDLFRVWYADANVLVRQKQESMAIRRIAPMLAVIIRQGVAEGVFTTKYPDQFACTLVGLSRGFEDSLAGLLLADDPPPDALEQLEGIMGSYSESIERILGAPAGSLPLGDVKLLKKWLIGKSGKKKS